MANPLIFLLGEPPEGKIIQKKLIFFVKNTT